MHSQFKDRLAVLTNGLATFDSGQRYWRRLIPGYVFPCQHEWHHAIQLIAQLPQEKDDVLEVYVPPSGPWSF